MKFSPEICTKAQRIIDDRRSRAELQLENRRAEVYKNAPEVIEVEKQEANAAAEISKLIISRNGSFADNFEKIKKNNLDAHKFKREILSAHGYPEDYLEINYSCPICSDTGFEDSGKRCSCFVKIASQLAVEELNKSANMPDCDFDHFDLDYYSKTADLNGVVPYDNMREVLRFCMRYAADFSDYSRSLLLMGNPGLGKTHLSISIAKEVLKAGFTCAYGSIQNYLTEVEKEHFGRGEQGKDTLSILTTVDLLILDDLGTETSTQFYESMIYNIINTRINTSRPTIVSTNFSADELQKKYNSRIISRLFGEYSKVNFYGTDIRFERKKQKQQNAN